MMKMGSKIMKILNLHVSSIKRCQIKFHGWCNHFYICVCVYIYVYIIQYIYISLSLSNWRAITYIGWLCIIVIIGNVHDDGCSWMPVICGHANLLTTALTHLWKQTTSKPFKSLNPILFIFLFWLSNFHKGYEGVNFAAKSKIAI